MIVLVAIAVSAVGWLNYRSLEQALLPRVLDRIETPFAAGRRPTSNPMSPARAATSQAFGLRVALHGLMRARRAGGTDPVDGVSEKTWRERIAGRLAAELEAKPAYAMFRDYRRSMTASREIVRVDRDGTERRGSDRSRRANCSSEAIAPISRKRSS